MEGDGGEELGDDNDSNATIFSTSSQGSAKTIISLPIEELRKTFGCNDGTEDNGSIDDFDLTASSLGAPTTPPNGSNRSISWKEYCRRARKYWSKEEYATFKKWIKELKELREARERHKSVPKLHPLMFGCWPIISIDAGYWETPEFFGRIDEPPPKEFPDLVVKINVPLSTKYPLPIGTNCCPRYCDFEKVAQAADVGQSPYD